MQRWTGDTDCAVLMMCFLHSLEQPGGAVQECSVCGGGWEPGGRGEGQRGEVEQGR